MKKTRRFLWALLPMAVALIFASCSSSDEVAEPTPATGTKTIPVKITVGMDDATRATVGSDNSTLYFHTADKLAVLSGGSCIALLNNTTIAEGSSIATFQGNMTAPSNVSSYGEVTVVLIGNENIGVQTTTNYSWANNGPAICVGNGSSSALNEAVKKYSYLTGTGTFNPAGENNYTLTQHTAFLNVAVTFKDGTAANENLSVTVTNNSSTIGTGSVTTETIDNDVVAKFVVPVAAGTTMNGATITFTGKDPITLSSTATLAGQSYRIEKTLSGSSAPAGVEAIDLGLPSGTLWANMNVGATSPEGYGDFFAWGETTGYTSVYSSPMSDHTFNWASYTKFGTFDGTASPDYGSTKYNITNGPTTLEPEDDAATVNWGSGWRMPTRTQMQELLDYTVSEWGTLNNVFGRFFYKKDGNGNKVTDTYIFLPAAGYRYDASLYSQGELGCYWPSSLGEDYSKSASAWNLYSYSGDAHMNCDYRYIGHSVRPVLAQ
jgi:hypothetical protein